MLLASFCCLYCSLWTYFTPYPSVSTVNFEHVIAGWGDNWPANKLLIFCFQKQSIEILAQYKIFSTFSDLGTSFAADNHEIYKPTNMDTSLLASAQNFKPLHRRYHYHNFSICCRLRPFNILETMKKKFFLSLIFL